MTTRITTIYRVKAEAATIEARAQGIAVEQSVEMPVAPIDDPFVLENVLGRVEEIKDLGAGEYEVRIGLASITTGYDAAQFINMILGNTSLQDGITLEDAIFPEDIVKAFGGPNHGLEGFRARVGAKGALSATALKPQGTPPATLARLAYDIALGGIDYIKDDHGLADQYYAPFAARVPVIAEAVHKARAKSGVATRYLPSLNGNLDKMRAQMQICRDNGVDGVLIAPMLCGFAQFQTIKAENPDFLFMTHPSMAGGPMAPAFFFGKLMRLMGSDASVFANYGGRFGYPPQLCKKIAGWCLEESKGQKPCVPVPAGGMELKRVPELLSFFGTGVILLIGGSLLSAKENITAETAKFCDAVRNFS
ncbi:ribulose-bisphosphate carboxylase large chain [Rhizomicrobium palustre]|uniref:Ribulose-bisphosphate carboxylase large chain n=1 Tax=Rhizomicrobium palustre TaxID=189966 RepID=A0A846N482_9PROT|nr:RuBisCO large subunit C-terminal-like domain-containing protein [Rhizomicrobium palustre]NIK90012.1 ribulose-bisphosphate carboxylase large chain [Rhizomicrobium palustre]